MTFLYQQRGTGKTSFLIHESKRTGIPIAVATKNQASFIKEKAQNEFGIDDLPEPFVATKENCEKVEEFYIDEVGYVLRTLLGKTPLLATMSDDMSFMEYMEKYHK